MEFILVDKPLRIIVNDVFSEGKGVTIRGRVVQGVVQVGDKLAVMPLGDDATVFRIDSSGKKYAHSGDTIEQLGLVGLEPTRISVGSILSPPAWRPPMVKKIQAKMLVLDGLAVPIIRGAQVVFHMHSLDLPAVISKLLTSSSSGKGNKQQQQKKKNARPPRALTSGVNASVEMTFKERLCVEAYTDCRALGRFVLRRGGDTIAVGLVESLLA